jgi:hypothetical protein
MAQRHRTKKGMATFCPACGSDLHFRRLPTRGSNVTCRECQSLLQVTRLAPLTLAWAFEDPFDDELDIGDYRERRGQSDDDEFDPVPGDADADWDDEWADDWDEEETEP